MKLQLGASRLENLPEPALRVFLSKEWIHLGDHPKAKGWRKWRRPDRPELYEKTNFQEFKYTKGDRLPFEDGAFDFIYSEHFFEHLFFDEAVSLFGECRRVLNGVMRVVVPDADLRTYESPEPIGYPSRRLSFTRPEKHKTRWSVYMLTEAFRFSGFDPKPIVYCDREGVLHGKVDSPIIQRPLSLIVDGH